MTQIVTLKENKYYTINELKKLFFINDSVEIEKILLELNNLGYLKMLRSNKPVNTNIDRLINNILFNDTVNKFKFSVRFVGMIKFNNMIILLYPKYISDMSIHSDMKNGYRKMIQIIQVITKYKNRIEQRIFLSHEDFSYSDDTLGLKLQILKKYFEIGLYIKNNDITKMNGDGEILWNDTVNFNNAYIVGKVPIYLDLITKEKSINPPNIISEIHKVIVSEISKELEEFLKIIKFNGEILTHKNLEDLGDRYYLLKTLETAMNTEFVDERVTVLQELILYIKSKSSSTKDGFETYGTSSFNLVWEDVCKVVYKNHLDYTFKALGLINPEDGLSDFISIKEYIEKPKWLTPNNDYINASSTLELDVLNIQNGTFNIYDAKYYNIEFENGKIKGQPGVADISKQYLYQLIFKDVIKLNDLSPTNSFVIPKDNLGSDNEIYTIAKMNLFHEINEGLIPIKVIARDCEIIYEEYLNSLT